MDAETRRRVFGHHRASILGTSTAIRLSLFLVLAFVHHSRKSFSETLQELQNSLASSSKLSDIISCRIVQTTRLFRDNTLTMSDNEQNEVISIVSPTAATPAPVVERVVVSILKVPQAPKSPNGTAAAKKCISFPPDDLLEVIYITYSADEYFRGRVRLPERENLVTYVPASVEPAVDDGTQEIHRECPQHVGFTHAEKPQGESVNTSINQSVQTDSENDDVEQTSGNSISGDASDVVGANAQGSGTPANADQATEEERRESDAWFQFKISWTD